MNKKAVAGFTLQMIIALMMVFVVCAAIAGLIYTHLEVPVDSQKAEADMFVTRLLFSEEGIALIDPLTGRIAPDKIEKSRFNSWNQRNEVDFHKRLAAKVKVADQEFFVNKPYFDRRYPILQAQYAEEIPNFSEIEVGPGSLVRQIRYPKGMFVYRYPVIYYGEQGAEYSRLDITVVVSDE